ncbi:hypothetical protein WISP_00913 [Willisornis vidua]|uniref:DED domain-containing protein n=1 Tax=Willisornis vidua TaxID=1566151 RepID=A0ABQ9DZB7_9PASS|nr:hypothetical protein WISP_00913 [Willisornis vidua]
MASASGNWDPDAAAGPGPLSPFLALLYTIAAGLSQNEVESMVFLCHENIRKRRREAVRSGMELFSILMEQGLLAPDDLRLLKSLLKHIRRSDLLLLVQEFEERGELVAPEDQPDEHEIRRWIVMN